MISSVLIANRGEIARRVIRTARRMGVRTVAVYSEADAASPHVREADEAVLIGPPPARESYLVADAILAAAKSSGAVAIHPGYGFLSENADFAERVLAEGRIWIGPPPAAIRAMGLKDAAKRLMIEAGVPVTPGYMGDDQSSERLAREAAAIGWPVLIKAVAGGGGKGMRKVDAAGAFHEALESARREAAASFGDDRVLLEKYVSRPRHIEVQIFGDSHGQVVHLFERDCSLQRRHQKVIEEAPAPGMDEATRQSLCAAAVRAGEAVRYQGAGTVEFIADASEGLRADRIWFMEMNTRLQVEHPVTEMITGLDLVEWQIRVASGEPLPLSQDQIRISGHAMEARLYAEDPARGFLPSTGPLTHFRLPASIRVDTGVEEGGAISPYYDPMIAKLIAHGPDRIAAAGRLAAACRSVEVWPVRTNAAFLGNCAADADFVAGAVDTGFIPERIEALTHPVEILPTAWQVGVAAATRNYAGESEPASPWDGSRSAVGFRLNASPSLLARVYLDDVAADLPFDLTGIASAGRDEGGVIFQNGAATVLSFARRPTVESAAGGGDGALRAPMPGRIVAMRAIQGQLVVKGEVLVILEAMKMEHAMAAPFDGVVVEAEGGEGGQVSEGALLVRLEARS